MVSVSVVPVSPSTRHPAARRRSFSASPRSSPRKRPPGTRPSRETLPTGVLNVVKSVCVSLAVGPVRRRTRTPTSARPHHNKAVTQSLPRSTSTTEQSLSSAVSMEGLLQCVNCGENFDLERRRPKLLPCGHTQCHACVLGCVRDNRVVCPTDKLIVHVDVCNLQDDLQLICWLEATAQGLLECVRCGVPFDWLLRRPTALDCGHSVCRVCLQEACEAPEAPLRTQPRALALPLARADSIDESWDYYSQEDGDLDVRDGGNTCSSMSSLSSDEGVALSVGELLVDCPIEGCLKGVRARDHLHLLGCLDDSAAPRNRVKRAILCEDQLLEKLSKLERRIATMYSDAGSLQTPSGTLDGSADVSALLASVRQLVEHKDSPRSEPPVFKQILNVANCTLPDVVLNKAAFRGNEDVTGIYSIKESQIELDVYNLSMCKPGEMRVKKEAALRSDKKVWKLTGVDCWCDPEWTLRLLQRCAPHVEQLQLQYPGREHLQVVRDCMPLLRRLEVRGWCGLDLQSEPFSFDEGPACKRDTLEWLEVFLPPQTALSLLRAHRGSLRKLRLVVADEWASSETSTAACCDDLVPDVAEEAGVEDEWPEEDGFAVVPWGEDCVADIPTSCWDALLRECGGDVKDPVALASVSLLWLSPRAHDSWTCRRFARALHDARPGVAVECEVCRRYGCGGVAAE